MNGGVAGVGPSVFNNSESVAKVLLSVLAAAVHRVK